MSKDRGPNVRVPPPLFFLTGFLIGLVLHSKVVPLRFVESEASERALASAGFAIATLGLLISAWGAITFWSAGTAVVPVHPASRLVQHGPYKFSRNPMYVGLSLGYVGIALAANMIWPLLVFPVVLWVVVTQVIMREERYLGGTFGDEYIDYKRRVRRWI